MTAKKKNRAVVGLMALVGVFFVVLILFSVYTVKVFKNTESSKENPFLVGSGGSDKIAVINVDGVIMKSEKTIKLIHKAEKDKTVKGIIMRINSPGGAVAPTQEIYNEIRRIDGEYTTSKGKKGKPIYSSFSSVAASGGYYLGAATRKICSLPGTITGSIGVIMQFMDLSKLYELAKLNPQTIKAGKYKDIGQPTRPLSAEEKGLMDGMIQKVHLQFIDDIKKTRAKKIKGNLVDLAQGQIFSGQGAYEVGLVDELSSLWDCARGMHKQYKFKGEMKLKEIKKRKKLKLFDIVNDLEKASSYIREMVESADTPLMLYK